MTDHDRFRRLDRLFQEVCDLPEGEIEARLRELSPDDATLRSEVLELLGAEARARESSRLDPKVMESMLTDALDAGEHDPQAIAGYSIIRRLGAGGMGVVYEAEQESPRRSVALKVLRPGLSSPSMVRRFEFEADALARLRHPSISQIFEAGVADTPAGPRPYFAMELVRGRPLDRWASGRSVREQLRMMGTICDAVQHAHAQGVMHRDLKPSNILITDEGLPKVLDFGIARAIDADHPNETLATSTGELVGTLPYMSPEQISGEYGSVDIRSDVYALGVVLFQVLTGRLPIDLSGVHLLDAAARIRDAEPTRLSSISPKLRGDIETIVRTALAKEPTRRYQTAAALADDIRRYLEGQTIAARPASAMYQLSKLARRHKLATGAIAAISTTVIVAVAAVSIALGIAVQQKQLAERKTRTAQAVTAFFNDDVLAAADPWSDADPNLTVVDALENAVAGLDGRFDDDPETEAAVRLAAGRILMNLGRHESSERQLRRASGLFAAATGDRSVETAEAQATLGLLLGENGQYEESRSLLERSTAVLEDTIGFTHSTTQDHLNSLVLTLMDLGDFDAARAIIDRQLPLAETRGTIDEDNAITILGNTGALTYKTGDIEGSVPYYEAMVERSTAHYGPDYIETLAGVSSLALIFQRIDRLDESRSLHARSIAGHTRALGAEHPYTLTIRNNYALFLSGTGSYDDALELFREILDIRLATLGEQHSDTMVSMMTTAQVLGRMRRFEEAEALGLRGMELLQSVLGPDHHYTRIGRSMMARIYSDWNRPEQAAAWIDQDGDG
ncbi:MAG: protein kinase domain-containing protein [Phycisphaerales bacterium]